MTKREKIFALLLVLIVVGAVVCYLFKLKGIQINVKDGVNLLVAFGTIGMTFMIVYIEVIKPWIQKPEIKIEFDNKVPFCQELDTIAKDENEESNKTKKKKAYWIRLRVLNKGGSTAKGLRGKLVGVTKKNGSLDTDFDPLFLHWTTIEPKPTDTPNYLNWGSFLDPIDLNKKEYEFLDIFYVIQGQEESKKPIKIVHTDFPRGCLKKFGMDKIENLFKITIYGENIEPVSKRYKLVWNGENYNKIEMYKVG